MTNSSRIKLVKNKTPGHSLEPGVLLNDVVIFGLSKFIDEVKEFIPVIQDKHTCVGINSFPLYFPNVDYWFFVDACFCSKLINNHNNQKVITQLPNKPLLDGKVSNVDYYTLEPGTINQDKTTQTLGMVCFTITAVLNWCLKNNFNRVHLVGIDMNLGPWLYHDKNKITHTSDKAVIKARDYIHKISEQIEIIQYNPESTLNLSKKHIKYLI